MELINGSKKPTKKILPISEPMITTYTQHAHLLSILTSYNSTYPWIFSNYILLYINRDYKHRWGDFYFPFPYELRPSDTCKWIKSKKIDRGMINSKWKSVINFIIDCINSNNYVHTMINYFFVPVSNRYNSCNLNHDILIYGYDIDDETLYVSDFFMNGKYSNERISFHDFNLAFIKYNIATNEDYLNGLIYLYKFNEQCDYKFNIKNITNSIKKYLLCNVPEYWDICNRDNKEDIVFGMDVYTTLKNYSTQTISESDSYIDIRPFYMLYDHKKIMNLRLKYLNEQGCFKNIDNNNNIARVDELESMAKTLVNLVIKYNYSKQTTLLNKIINMLTEIEKKEYDILKQYIQD